MSATIALPSFYSGDKLSINYIKGYFAIMGIFIALPFLIIIFYLVLQLISLWYYILFIAVLIALFLLLGSKKEKNWLRDICIIILSIASMYFLYDAKSILT